MRNISHITNSLGKLLSHFLQIRLNFEKKLLWWKTNKLFQEMIKSCSNAIKNLHVSEYKVDDIFHQDTRNHPTTSHKIFQTNSSFYVK